MSVVTDFRRSSLATVLGTVSNAASVGGVTISSNGIASAGWVLVATGSNSAIWRDAISFGSNATDVSSVSAAGSSPSNSRADHVHRGVTSVTHSSNTFYGSITLTTPGNTVAITSPAAGTLALAAPGAGGGAGGISQLVIGYDTAGASFETVTNRRVYMKSVTLSEPRLITNIEAYVDNGGTNDVVSAIAFALFADNGGTPRDLLVANIFHTQTIMLDAVNGAGGNTNTRWFGQAIGRWCPAGTYWLAVAFLGTAMRIAYDAGSDLIYTSGGDWLADAGWYAVSNSSRSYSIRANTIW